MVLVGHCVPSFFPFAEIYVPIKRVVSQVGVELFLVVSGYGVASTYLTTTCSPISFFVRRLVKLWPLYALVMVAYYTLSIFLFKEEIDSRALLTNLLWLQVFFHSQNDIYSAAHFFSALLVVYLVSSLMMLCKTTALQCTMFFLSLVSFQFFCFKTYGAFLFPDYIASFSLGLFLGYKYKMPLQSQYPLMLLLSYCFCLLDLYVALKAVLGVICLGAALLFIKNEYVTKAKGSLFLLGVHSYVIYLGHNYFLWKWPEILAMNNSVAVTGAIIVVATLVWLLVLYTVNMFLQTRVVAPVLKRLH